MVSIEFYLPGEWKGAGKGMPRACVGCGSTEHVLKDCPKNPTKVNAVEEANEEVSGLLASCVRPLSGLALPAGIANEPSPPVVCSVAWVHESTSVFRYCFCMRMDFLLCAAGLNIPEAGITMRIVCCYACV